MNVQIIYLTKKDKSLHLIAEDIALNVIGRLEPLRKEIKDEKAGIFIYFGNGNSKIKISASFKLQQAISLIL